MNRKYERYIDFIVNDLEIPYFKNMKDNYGLRPDEYEMVLSKLYKQPVSKIGGYVYDNQENIIYFENSDGWQKWVYDNQENIIYYEDSDGDIADNR